jgi:putative ABC transport system ATP-binding protein
MLKIDNISKTFNPGTVNEKAALTNLSLELKNGDFATIVGSNGAGKSTMFNAIAGTFIVDEGNIYLDDEDITFKKEYMRSRVIGHLFQDPLKGTAPNMTIEENMALAYLRASHSSGKLFSRISAKDKSRFREQLSLLGMGLEDRMKQPVGLLSGGQRQALTLLMATFVTPKLLLLDEHTAALDPKTAAKVLEITDMLIREHNLTAMMVTHNMRDAITYGNRLIMMNEGRVILNISGEEKKNLSIEDLLHKFEEVSGTEFTNDTEILSK